MQRKLHLFVSALLLSATYLSAQTTIIQKGSVWKYLDGNVNPGPTWNQRTFDDSAWAEGAGPLGCCDAHIVTTVNHGPAGARYPTILYRKSFNIARAADHGSLTVAVLRDDGVNVFLNGVQLFADNAPATFVFGNYAATTPVGGADETTYFEHVVAPDALVDGMNVIAVACKQANATSSDIGFDLELTSTAPDLVPPTILSKSPAPGTISDLPQITVTFSEPVLNVDAGDLLINGLPATSITGTGDSYNFGFPVPDSGLVQITWAAGHGIEDFGANPFNATAPGATWQYTLVDLTAPITTQILPVPETTTRTLTSIQIQFSEDVQGVDAADLLINNIPAQTVNAFGADTFEFFFPEPLPGNVNVTWAAGHGIQDLAGNAFAAANFSYILDPNATFSDVRINEFMAANDETIRDEDGDAEDWIELYNGGTTPIDLTGWYLTDDPFNLNKWQFPALSLLPNSYLLVWASGKNRVNPSAPLHANFQLNRNEPGSPNPDYLALVLPDGVSVVSAFGLSYPVQFTDISYGRDRITPSIVGYFTQPTPRAPNSTLGAGIGPAVEFSVTSKTFQSTFQLELSVPQPGFTIRYHIADNSSTASQTGVPNTSSPAYTGPITVNRTMQVRARAFPISPNLFPGPVGTESYVQINAAAADFTSDAPIIIMHSFGAAMPGRTRIPSIFMGFGTNTPSGRSALTNAPDVATLAGFGRRGSSTFNFNKASFNVEFDEFWDGTASPDKELPLFGMPQESDWVLFAPNQFDRLGFHNPIAHELGREIGHWSPRTRFAEVFLNTAGGTVTFNPPASGNYYGMYVLEEKIKVDNNRLDIDRLEPENVTEPTITGGYIMKIDRGGQADDAGAFFPVGESSGTIRESIKFVDPDGLVMTSAQYDQQEQYIKGWFDDFVTALYGPNFTDPTIGYAAFIDPNQWIENHILNTFTFNVDGYRLSGFFYKERDEPGKPGSGKLKQGPLWDFDRSLGTGCPDQRPFNPRQWRSPDGGDQGTDMFGNPSFLGVRWWQRLFNDPDFWQRWIDKWQDWRMDTFSNSNIVRMVDDFGVQVMEAADRNRQRWPSGNGTGAPRSGGCSKNGYSYTFNGTLQDEVDFQKQWLEDRLAWIDSQFLNRPALSSAGGQVPNGFTVTITAPGVIPGTTIYYTLDGTDPRSPGGGIAPGARSGTSPVTIVVTQNIRIFARNRNPNHSNVSGIPGAPPLSSPWSGPTVGTYYVAVPPLRVTEIMYHPADALPGDTNATGNFEYIEVQNIGGTPLNLNRFQFSGGIKFDFPNLLLGAGDYAVVVKNQAAFVSRYGSAGIRIAGVFENNLGNAGDRIILTGALKEPIHDFEYSDEWYPITDGPGFSLQIVDANAPLKTTVGATQVATWGLKESWRPSGATGGSPGATDPGTVAVSPVYVNEALTHTDPPISDAVELYNPNNTSMDISGWFLTDNFGNPKKYRFPSGTVIPALGYQVFYESNSFGLGPNGFALSSKGDALYLFSGDVNTNLSGYFHGFDYGAQANGVTFGRHVISTGNDHFVAQSAESLGQTNAGPKVGPVVISEVMYHPLDVVVEGVPQDNVRDEFIELHNTSSSVARLYDPAFSTNTWKLDDAVRYTFPMNVSLPPGGHLLVVGFDPADTAELDAFRARNNVAPDLPVFGPWSGKLDNSSDRVELLRPDTPDLPPLPTAGLVPYILVERVHYKDVTPWPEAADGLGLSLQRLDPDAYGNDPINWIAAGPAPGHQFQGGNPPVITTQPVSQIVTEGDTVTFTVAVTGSGPFTYLWRRDGDNLGAPSTPTLTLDSALPSDQGAYSVVILGAVGAVTSSNATLTVKRLPVIVTQPQSQAVTAGQNVTLSVAATGTGTLSYQWFQNGVPVPGETGSTITIVNAQLFVNDGFYSVSVTDSVGTRLSDEAFLSVLMVPEITLQPQPVTQTVEEGRTFSISLTAYGTLPISFRWRHTGQTFTNMIVFDTNATLVVENAKPGLHDSWWDVAITNIAGRVLRPTARATVTIVPAAPFFAIQPVNQSVPVGSTLTLISEARGTDPISYQWYFNDVALSQQTGPTLEFGTVAPILAGDYYVVAQNSLGTVTSTVAQVEVLSAPRIDQQPANQTTTICSDAVFSVSAIGADPLSYQWYFNGTDVLPGETSDTLTIIRPVPAQAGNYSVVITDVSGSVTSDVAELTVLLGDSDNDGMSDTYELANGLDPCDPADRDLDPDQDGRTNWEESVSGTDPNRANSVLRVTLVDGGNGGARIQFTARSDVGYTIEYRADLTSGVWMKLTDIAPQPGEQAVDFTDSNAGADGTRFYRIVTPIQP